MSGPDGPHDNALVAPADKKKKPDAKKAKGKAAANGGTVTTADSGPDGPHDEDAGG